MIPRSELHERLLRIAGRATVNEYTAICAVLGAAGIAAESLDELTDAQDAQVLGVARAWDADDTDTNDPTSQQLYVHVRTWLRLRGEL